MPIPLSETDLFVLFKDGEVIFLFDKDLNKDTYLANVHGNFTCGLIGESNEWIIVGGDNLVILRLRNDSEVESVDTSLKKVRGVRQVGDHEVLVLTDPWSDGSAIWSLDIRTGIAKKIRDFLDYRNKEYTDHVAW